MISSVPLSLSRLLTFEVLQLIANCLQASTKCQPALACYLQQSYSIYDNIISSILSSLSTLIPLHLSSTYPFPLSTFSLSSPPAIYAHLPLSILSSPYLLPLSVSSSLLASSSLSILSLVHISLTLFHSLSPCLSCRELSVGCCIAMTIRYLTAASFRLSVI